ncbi:glycosyltransferase family 4 protein [Thalassococcus sp. BH17M4-6]|uniref:glycosyltransferase family 4 protein n=1 Tax=Thalassococcus sp. BH17M4-6 TaxID=3413148 RepID=UPI003BC7B55B
MHVLITVNAAWNIWNFRRPVVQALLADGHQVTVLAPPDDFVGKLTALGCRFVPLRMNAKGLNPIDELKLLRRFRQVFQEQKPDIVLSYTIKNNTFGALAAKSLGIPFVPNVSGLGTGFLSGGTLQFVVEQLYRRAFRRLPIVFFQNEDDQDLFVTRGLVAPGQARRLPGSGIDLDHFEAIELPQGAAPVFLLIARLLRDKGVVEFVGAARQIKASRPEVRFQLLGAAGSENRTAISEDTVRGWVKEGLVEYLGTTDDVRPIIATAECVVLPSYREGAPRTLIEAAAMARPLIASDVPGCRAVVDHDVTGFLCRVRDADSLAEAMLRFLDLDPEQRSEMGLAGRAKMEREYDQALVVQAYLEAIRELTGQGG